MRVWSFCCLQYCIHLFFLLTRPGMVPDIHKAGTKPHAIKCWEDSNYRVVTCFKEFLVSRLANSEHSNAAWWAEMPVIKFFFFIGSQLAFYWRTPSSPCLPNSCAPLRRQPAAASRRGASSSCPCGPAPHVSSIQACDSAVPSWNSEQSAGRHYTEQCFLFPVPTTAFSPRADTNICRHRLNSFTESINSCRYLHDNEFFCMLSATIKGFNNIDQIMIGSIQSEHFSI